MQRYEELRIRLRRTAPGRYLVLASGSACAVSMLVCEESEPARLRGELDRLIGIELGSMPRGRTRVEEAVPELGRRLYDMLFPEPLSQCFTEALKLAQSRGMRLRLRFDLPSELQELPIEVLTSPPDKVGGRMALNPDLSLVRTLGTGIGTARSPHPQDRPDKVRVVIAVASGTGEGMAPIDAEAEVAGLEKLPDLAAETCRVPAVREDLVRALEEGGERASALVLAAHGSFDAEERVGAVFLQTPEGRPHRIPAHVLGSSLSQSGRLRLAVLNLCSGAVAAAAEPHAGLAQDLVSRGVPAVAAMRGPISDRAAARFSPELMAKLLENRTVDEAVTAARIAISAVPDHTTVEWSTPVLFLHESHRQGWLFKARRPLKRGETASIEDPLRGGAQALDEYEREGNVRMDTILTALYHLRDSGEWRRVERIAVDHADSVCRALHAEACRERDWPAVAELCEALDVSGDADRAEELLGSLSEQSPPGLREQLMQEIRAVRLRNAEDVAERHRTEGAWSAAAEAYAAVTALRAPDQFPETAAALLYCRARASEEAGDWSEARSQYAEAGGFADAWARAAYAAGHSAAEDDKWETAAAQFEAACALAAAEADPSWPGHAAYARGRLATERDEWAHAAECFEQAGELADSPARLLLCRSRSAIEAAQWSTALDHLLQLDARGGDAQPWLRRVCTRLRESAVEAASRRDWATAQGMFTSLSAADPQVTQSAAYCAGRLAEQDAQWRQAADAYETASGCSDADLRLAYARARLAEQAGDWSQAAAAYEGLPGYLLDTGRRLGYARGRAADARADWQGVIHGFGGLPDEAEHGDVGARRRYARARIAEARGDWNSVLNFLADLPGPHRDGAVAVLRAKARGGQAEQRGDWAAALAHYAEAADAYQATEPADAARRLHAYARARRHEMAHEWHQALEAYAQLPDDYRDSAHRACYARARDAEQRAQGASPGEAEHWAVIADGYAALPPDFEDAGTRARYARAHCAEASGRWPDAVYEAAQLADYGNARAIVAYARAREAELAGDWPTAAAEFGHCAGRRDANARGAHARGRALEAAGQWSAALALYQQAGDAMTEAEERRRRTRKLLDAIAWADGLATQALVADPFALGKDAFPYRALQDVGVTSASSIDEVQDAPFVLMELGGMTGQQHDAWEKLRRPATRLEIDALLYQVRQPKKLRSRLAELEPTDAADLLEHLCAELPEDAPLLRLLAHGRDEALKLWDEELAGKPGDMETVHAAAVARRWQAIEYEEGGAWEHAVAAWHRAVPLWAAVLSSDGYWNRWSEARTDCYRRPVPPEDVTQLRWVLSRRLTERLAGYAERHAAKGREAQSEDYRELVAAFEVELDGARELSEIGGLVQADGSPDTIAAGPEYVRTMGLQLRLAETAAGLEREAARGGSSGQALQGVRWAFSSLAEAFTLYGHQRFEAALCVLPGESADLRGLPEDCPEEARGEDGHTQECPHCAEFLDRDPVYTLLPRRRARLLRDTAELVVRARLACARAALTADRRDAVSGALVHWREGLRAADAVKMGVRTKSAILKTVLGRANTLAGAASTEVGAKLDQAVALVDGASELLRPLASEERGRFVAKHAQLLATRGMWRGFTCTDYGLPRDLAAGEADLRRALELDPSAVYPRNSLVRSLVFGMAERIPADDSVGRMRTLREAYRLLHEGLRHQPTNSRFTETLIEIVRDVETILLNGLSVPEMRTRMDEVAAELEQAGDDARALAEPLAAASVAALESGDITAGLDKAVRATRYDPQVTAARAALERSLEAWLTRHDPDIAPEQ